MPHQHMGDGSKWRLSGNVIKKYGLRLGQLTYGDQKFA